MTAPRAVLVTGASRGIGRAIATAFAEQGDRVAVHVRSAVDEGEATRASLPGEIVLTDRGFYDFEGKYLGGDGVA